MKTVKAAVSQAQNQIPDAQQASFLLASGHTTAARMERMGWSQMILVKKGSFLKRLADKLTQRCFKKYLQSMIGIRLTGQTTKQWLQIVSCLKKPKKSFSWE